MNKSKDYRARMKTSCPSTIKTWYISEEWRWSLFKTESCVLKKMNHAVAVSSYPRSDSFYFSLLSVRGEFGVRVTHFFIRAFKNSFLDSSLLADLLKDKLAASQ